MAVLFMIPNLQLGSAASSGAQIQDEGSIIDP